MRSYNFLSLQRQHLVPSLTWYPGGSGFTSSSPTEDLHGHDGLLFSVLSYKPDLSVTVRSCLTMNTAFLTLSASWGKSVVYAFC